MRSFDFSKKRIILICLFLSIFIIGTVFIFITPLSVKSTYGLTTQTDDGVTISFNVFEPQIGGLSKPAFIIGHGSMVNKEMVKGYAIQGVSEYFKDFKNKDEIIKFVKKQLGSESPSTKKKAKEFLKRWGK